MIRVIIVDDEESGINVLKHLITKYFTNIEIIGMYNNISDAELAIKKDAPDILFLDIQMPDGNGFSLLERLETIHFSLVFVTAYDQYAIRALKMSATDYLLKPVNRTELQFAIEKSLTNNSFYKEGLLSLKNITNNLNKISRDKILILNKYKGESIPLGQIVCVEADSNYCIIHTVSKGRISVTKPLKELDEILCDDTYSFLRIHKSVIINSEKIIKVENKKDILTIHLYNNFSFSVSKRKKEEIKQILFKINVFY